MTKALRVHDYLGHILKAIERIVLYTENMDDEAFLHSEMVQDAVIRNLGIIGEASNSILRFAPEFAAEHKFIPWMVMYTMRNRLTHGYDKVDLEIVWKTIQGDLPSLHSQITKLRNSYSQAQS